ncbi:MAG: hypothetical protein ACM3P1_09165 [Candidatus Saccharibacteria bacterium]
MIKLGIFGDQTSSPDLIKRIGQMPGVTIEGVYLSGNVAVPEGFKEFFSPVELMRLSDAVLVISEKSISNDLIRLILRKSKHIYLRAIPQLSLREIKELTDLEKEAGIVNYIYNPFDFIPYFDALTKKDNPVLINLRTCFEGKALTPGNEMLLLVTALHRMVQNNYKKTEVFGIKDSNGQLVINTRIEYEDSSVVNLTVTKEQSSGHCEIFRYSGKARFEFIESLYNAYPDKDKEYTSICNFIHVIQQGEKPANSFDNLQNGVRIVNEINEHLRFNDIRV